MAFFFLTMQRHCKQPSTFPLFCMDFWRDSIMFIFHQYFVFIEGVISTDFHICASRQPLLPSVVLVCPVLATVMLILKQAKLQRKRIKRETMQRRTDFWLCWQVLKKEKGIHDITTEKFWSVQRCVSKIITK